MKMKKISAILLVSMLLMGQGGLVEANQVSTSVDAKASLSDIDSIEKEKEKIYAKHLEKYKLEYEKFNKESGKNNISQYSSSEKVKLNEMKNKHLANAKRDIDKYMASIGFEKVSNETDITIQSDPSDLALNDYLYHNSSTGEYNFDGYWDFSTWDTLVDTIDVAAVRMNNDSYPIIKSYAYSYDQAGNQTGYDNNGSPSSGSRVTKKFENKSGVVYNVQDTIQSTSGGPIYKTDHGRLSIFFKKGSGSNKIFLDFEHNFATYSWQATASISGVSLNGLGLSVTYSKVNNRYNRTSAGETVN